MTSKSKIAVAVLAALALAGAAAWAFQYQTGLIVTNMRNPFSWGIYIATWAFYVGTAAGGLVVSSAIYLFGAKELKPMAKIGSTTAFVFVVASMLMILPDLGRPDNMLNMLLYPNLNSMLPWDLLVLSLYALISAIYTYVQIRPDLAKTGITVPLIGTIMKEDIGEDELSEMRRRSDRHARLLAPIGLVFAILIHTVTAWVLATQLSRPWWYGGLLAPTFIAAALASGSAIVILTSLATMGHRPRLTGSYGLLAKISAVSTIALLFLYYNDFVVRFWWSQGAEFETLSLVLSDYLALHATEAILMVVGVALLVARWRNPNALTIGSLSIIVGILAHRLLLIPPAYNFNPFQLSVISAGEVLDWTYPIAVGEVRGSLLNPQSIFVAEWSYFPSAVEIIISVGLFAAMVLALLTLLKLFPIAEHTGIEEEA